MNFNPSISAFKTPSGSPWQKCVFQKHTSENKELKVVNLEIYDFSHSQLDVRFNQGSQEISGLGHIGMLDAELGQHEI